MGPKVSRVTIFFGPHVANFIAKPSSNFFLLPMLHVYPSLHVSEFTSPSSTFICHLAFVHPPWASSSRHSSRVGRAKCETFLVCENTFEWCRVFWDPLGRCQGATLYGIFLTPVKPVTRKLSYSRGVVIVPHGLTFYILGVFGSNQGAFQTCVLKERVFWGQEHVPSTMR